MRRRRVAAIGSVIMLVTTASALAAGQPTGNPQGIKLARSVQRAYKKLRAFQETKTGYVAIKDQRSGRSSLEVRWASGVVPSGWSSATEHEQFVLKRGRIVWWQDELTPSCSGKPSCRQVPALVIVDHSGAFWALGDPANHTCFGTLNGTAPFRAGELEYVVSATFSAPVKRRHSVLLKYSFAWNKTQTATETDAVSAKTLLTKSGVIKISRGTSSSQPAFTVRFSDHYGGSTPALPTINRC